MLTAAADPKETPPTVTATTPRKQRQISLDEAIRIALENSEVVRVLGGNLAVSSGRTIYDPAITNTAIDQARARFDPTLALGNTWSQTDTPSAVPDAVDPTRSRFAGTQVETFNFSLDASQTNLSGGTAAFRLNSNPQFLSPGSFPLNPSTRYSTELSYTQPLLSGAGVEANRVPIVLARIDTERSYFQFRDSVQELVRGVIDAYWSLVSARTNRWARQIQVNSGTESYNFTSARLRAEIGDITEVSQSASALAQFRATLIAAESTVLNAEAALKNILGLRPGEPFELVPTTPPTAARIDFDWPEMVRLAEARRPDLIELKLILEADQQKLLQSRNLSRPNLDAVALYRWNGLEGTTPAGTARATNGDDFMDWTLGINFSVPVYLRAERAAVRSGELLIARDRANLEQGIHAMQHEVALDLRSLALSYAQYEAFGIARDAAQTTIKSQFAAYRTGNPVLFLNVLQAITDWGNSVSQAAQSLAQYNTGLANIERDTGTILETHGIWMQEDRDCSLGTRWWKNGEGRLYPRSIRPSHNAPQYEAGDNPSENFFDLEDYPKRRSAPSNSPRTDRPGAPVVPRVSTQTSMIVPTALFAPISATEATHTISCPSPLRNAKSPGSRPELIRPRLLNQPHQ